MKPQTPLLKGKKVDIFKFSTFSAYFSAYVQNEKEDRPSFSYRVMCRDSGIKSASLLTWIASGKRLPTPDVLEKLNEYIGWSPDQYAYAQALVNFEKAKTAAEKNVYLERMQQIAPSPHLTLLEQAQIEVVMKWHVLAILEITSLKDFKYDLDWIYDQLEERIDKSQIQDAINKLLKTGILELSEGNKLLRPIKHLFTKDHVAIAGAKNLHVEMLKQAQRAVYMQSPEERFFSTTVMGVKVSKLKEAQALLAEFRSRFIELCECGEEPEEIYQFGINFFRLAGKKQ